MKLRLRNKIISQKRKSCGAQFDWPRLADGPLRHPYIDDPIIVLRAHIRQAAGFPDPSSDPGQRASGAGGFHADTAGTLQRGQWSPASDAPTAARALMTFHILIDTLLPSPKKLRLPLRAMRLASARASYPVSVDLQGAKEAGEVLHAMLGAGPGA